jgi:hypothetical protein
MSTRTIRLIGALSIPAVVFGLGIPAPAAPSGRVQIVNANSNLCLSPAGGNKNINDEMCSVPFLEPILAHSRCLSTVLRSVFPPAMVRQRPLLTLTSWNLSPQR